MVSFAVKLLVQIIFPLDYVIFFYIPSLSLFAALMQEAIFEGWVLTGLPFRPHSELSVLTCLKAPLVGHIMAANET